MSLGNAQREFALDVSYLIQHIYTLGYECTLGDAYRDPRSHGAMNVKLAYGRAKSAHKQRLAIDLNLFRDGKYLRETEDYLIFGDFWKSQNPKNVWGGDFDDGNHFSRKHWGVS